MPELTFAPKAHMRGARGFAVHLGSMSDDSVYLGDVGPAWVHVDVGFLVKTPQSDQPKYIRSGWYAHPAGGSDHVEFVYPSRASAAAALYRRWAGDQS